MMETAEQICVHELLRKQWEFASDRVHREIIISGAYRSGKTVALCARALSIAQNPGAIVGVFRRTAAGLKATTLRALLEWRGDMPPILPAGSYEHRKIEQRIFIRGGGQIVYAGFDDPDRVGGYDLSDVCVDEGVELSEDEYRALIGRPSVTYALPDGEKPRNTIAIATNPSGYAHFLYQRFYEEHHPERRVLNVAAWENTFLPPDILAGLSELTGSARARYYEGQWCDFEGAVYVMFSPARHVVEEHLAPDCYVAGVDVGMRNPTVCRIHAVNRAEKASHVVEEFYRTGVVTPDFCAWCIDAERRYPGLSFVVDPSALDLITQLRNSRLTVHQVPDRDVARGIRLVQSCLESDRLTFSPDCRQGNAEYALYRWSDRGLDRPVKEFDHAIDADRYALTWIHSSLSSPQNIRAPWRRISRREEMRLTW